MPAAAAAELQPHPHLTRMAVARRLAAGYAPAEAARAVGVDDAAADALLADPGFRELVDAYRGIADRPEDEQVARLVRVAKCVLEDALDRGDMRAAAFVIHEAEERGRSPARVLAERAVRALRRKDSQVRAHAPASPPAAPAPSTAARRRMPPTWKARVIQLASAKLCAALRAEHGVLNSAPVARTPPPVRRAGGGRGQGGQAPDPAPAIPAQPERPLNRRERRRRAALLRRKRGRAPPPAA